MSTFDKAVEFVLRREDEISNDPTDPGGLTKWGIASRWHPEVLIPTFTRLEAIRVYKKEYWEACRCDELPPAIAFALFDSAVNNDRSTAIRLLQRALGVTVDGKIGQQTLGAANTSSLRTVIPEFVAQRAFYYSKLPQILHNGLGWYRRLAECHQLALDLIA